MAASLVSPPLVPRAEFFKSSPSQARLSTPAACYCSRRPCPAYSAKQPRLQFSERRTVKVKSSHARERLWAVRDFPWKKAEEMALQRSLSLGRRVLKWSFLTVLALSSLSDILHSFSANSELMIPLGLFVGCTAADFLKEVSREFSLGSEERAAIKCRLLGIGGFFVLVKLFGSYLAKGQPVFLLHVANGGLMQVLWLWKRTPAEGERDEGVILPSCNPSVPMDA